MFFVLFLGIFVGAVADRYALERMSFTGQTLLNAEQIKAQEDALAQLREEIRQSQGGLDASASELMVERAARQELENQLKNAQAETAWANERLAFFEQLLPPGPEGALEIRGLQVEHDGPGLKYKVLLMRSGHTAGATFTGVLSFKGKGLLNGEPATVDLVPMQAKPKKQAGGASDKPAPRTFEFEQYFRGEGVLALPEGFIPEHVTVNVQEGNTVRASRTVGVER